MKTLVYSILALFFIAIITFSCVKESNDENNISQELELSGEIVNSSSCKSELKSTFKFADTPDTLSCIHYEYNPVDKKLSLTHINAGFNCCPEGFYVETSLDDNTITIQEFENESLCDCNCLYDLEIELTEVEQKAYMLDFIEPYADGLQKISFEIDLANDTIGEYCVIRKKYPWVECNLPIENNITGVLVSHTSCKNESKSTSEEEITPDSLSCVKYLYDDLNNKLYLKHINAGFNCCPESLYIETNVYDNTITIQEFEGASDCDCNCLYDLEIELSGIGIDNKEYQLIFIEPYVGEQNILDFKLDLTKHHEGEWCAIRTEYPWAVEYGSNSDIYGSIVGNTGCKVISSVPIEPTPDTLSCIEYDYDNSTKILSITHFNAGFNCCPENLSVVINQDANVITIEEVEEGPLCDCLCLFDIDIEIANIEAKSYKLVFIEPYFEGEDLFIDVDLSQNVHDKYCIERDTYPWVSGN